MEENREIQFLGNQVSTISCNVCQNCLDGETQVNN